MEINNNMMNISEVFLSLADLLLGQLEGAIPDRLWGYLLIL